MLRAVIFDFDGVITDSEILHFRVFNKVLAPHNIELSKKDYYKDFLGLSDLDAFNLLVERGILKLDENGVREIALEKNRLFEDLVKEEGNIIEGVRDFLKLLKANNILIAICSGSLLPEIEIILEQAKLSHFFDVIVSAEQVRKGKPNPEGFLLTLKELNKKSSTPVSPKQCVVIEDSRWGLEAAEAAKMHSVAITNSYEAEQLVPSDKIIDHFSELSLKELEELCN